MRDAEMWWRRWGGAIEKETCLRAPWRFDILFLQTSHSALIGQWLRWAKTVSLMSPASVRTHTQMHAAYGCMCLNCVLISCRWRAGQSSQTESCSFTHHAKSKQFVFNSKSKVSPSAAIKFRQTYAYANLQSNLLHRNANIFVMHML